MPYSFVTWPINGKFICYWHTSHLHNLFSGWCVGLVVQVQYIYVLSCLLSSAQYKKIFSSPHTLPTLLVPTPRRPATWAGSRAGSPVSVSLSVIHLRQPSLWSLQNVSESYPKFGAFFERRMKAVYLTRQYVPCPHCHVRTIQWKAREKTSKRHW